MKAELIKVKGSFSPFYYCIELDVDLPTLRNRTITLQMSDSQYSHLLASLNSGDFEAPHDCKIMKDWFQEIVDKINS